jgi:hypothetical protein
MRLRGRRCVVHSVVGSTILSQSFRLVDESHGECRLLVWGKGIVGEG